MKFRSLLTVGVLLLSFCSLGGLRYHQSTRLVSSDNILRFAQEEPEPIRLTGRVASEIEIIEAEHGPRIPAWMEVDTSRFVLKVMSVEHDSLWEVASGSLRVDVSGHLVHVRIGDEVQLIGSLSRPGEVMNPGGFDFKEYLRREGIDALLRVSHPQAVKLINASKSYFLTLPHFRESIRQEARRLITANLSKETVPIAISLLLGDRSLLGDELREQFAKSGAMHLLAISGLHVGILAGLIAVLCRIFDFSPRTSYVILALTIVLFAGLTNHRPPVLRATFLILLITLGLQQAQRVDGMNLLACCACVLLLMNPATLFDVGAQLSFLAVGAICWSQSLLTAWRRKQATRSQSLRSEAWRWMEWFRPLTRSAIQMYVITAAIWLATLPLSISTFHLAAPIGYLLNLILIPYMVIALGAGYLFLFAGLLIPYSAILLASTFDVLLQGLLQIVEWAQSIEFGHFHSHGLPTWWMAGYYLILFALWGLIVPLRWGQKMWKPLGLWIVMGLVILNQPAQSRGQFRNTVLSVGHGLATVIELPTGEVLLYDSGTFGDGTRAERTVENYLRSAGHKRIDAVIISHADHDHFSGLFGLIEKFEIGSIFVGQTFLDFEQHGVVALCDLASSRGIPIRIIQAGDKIKPRKGETAEVSLRVLHPAPDFHSKFENANSIVIELQTENHRALLTGDIEKDGLERLIQRDVAPFDIVIAPHHGSARSSPQEFFDWAQPKHVIISSGDKVAAERIQQQLGTNVNVLGTATSGAVSIKIDEQGELEVEPYMSEQK